MSVIKGRAAGFRYAVRKRRPLDHGGFTTDPDGHVLCSFEVTVDLEKLCYAVGSRAAFSPKGVSKLQGGAVVVRLIAKDRFDVDGKTVQ